jgi:hypothetical protein
LGSTKEQRGNRRHLWSGAPDCPVCHQTVSGVPPDMSGAPENSNSNSSPSGISRGNSAQSGVHQTVSGAPRKSGLKNSPASGIHFSCSAIIHRTVRCTPDCPVYLWGNGYFGANGYLQCIYCTPMLAHRTLYSTCPVRHRTSRRVQKSELQWSEPNGFGDVAGAPDMSGVHRTVRCTIRQSTPPND